MLVCLKAAVAAAAVGIPELLSSVSVFEAVSLTGQVQRGLVEVAVGLVAVEVSTDCSCCMRIDRSTKMVGTDLAGCMEMMREFDHLEAAVVVVIALAEY